jgi:Cd(II)/Pb(II)-responsive transcriptional regulator
MRIGEVATLTETPVDTIRYYERQGLLPAPARTGANYRAYSTAQVERLHFIRRCRSLDMSLAEIRSLLVFCDQPQRHCQDVNTVLDEHIRQVEQRIEELTRLARELKQLRAVCRAPGKAEHCRILTTLRSDAGRSSASTRRQAGRSHAKTV